MTFKRSLFVFLVAGLVLVAAAAQLPRKPAPEGAKVYFITPKHGDVVRGPVKVQFGLSGMGVAPAGVAYEKTGHHHVLVDQTEPMNFGLPIPNDENHRHFGGGQTEAVLDLKPGKHTLQLLVADELHVAHEPPIMSEKITITVE
jgi:hypothetical protein